jgi:bacteriorhodopsin
MSIAIPYPAQLDFEADRHISRWRPLVQWLLAVPHLMVAQALNTLRQVLTMISLFTVLFTKQIPRPLFDAIAMTYRYEWRAVSYALFLHVDYPPFSFTADAADDGAEPHTALSLTYPGELNRWKPLYKWFLAIPHYVVALALAVAAAGAVVVGFFAVLFTGQFPLGPRDFIVKAWRYGLRVQAYVGLLTDQYPPFALRA